jgi:cytochrome c oxidase assembly protein subunit 11
MSEPVTRTARSANSWIPLACVVCVAGMVGLAYASVPLYRLFCQVTGYGGTTQAADAGSDTVLERTVNVRFDANTARDMAWSFKPEQRQMTLKIGETGLAFYKASNPTARTITGTATFNVTPPQAGAYFNKIDCFCFTEQTLAPGASADMPVSFFVDPAIVDDPEVSDVGTITLSYTFFPAARKQAGVAVPARGPAKVN